MSVSAAVARRRAGRGAGALSSGFVVILVAMFATIFREFTGVDAIGTVGSYTVTTAEPLLVALVATLAVNLRRHRVSGDATTILVLLFAVAVAVSLLRGIRIDAFRALFLGRPLSCLPLFFIVALLLGQRGAVDLRIVRAVKWAAVLLAALVFSRTLTGFPPSDQLAFDGRPLTSYGGLLMAIAALLCLSDAIRLRERGWELGRAATLIVACVASRQGTVIVALGAVLPVLLLGERGRFKASRWLGGAAVVPVLLAWPLLRDVLSSSRAFETYVRARSGTNLTRQAVWSSFLRHYPERATLDQWIGLPIGRTEDLFIELWHGVYWRRSLHSMYFQTMSDVGYAGLAIYVLLLGWTGLVLLTRRRPPFARGGPEPLSRYAMFVVVLLVAVFGYSYDLRGEVGFVLMLAIATAVHARSPGGAVSDNRKPLHRARTSRFYPTAYAA